MGWSNLLTPELAAAESTRRQTSRSMMQELTSAGFVPSRERGAPLGALWLFVLACAAAALVVQLVFSSPCFLLHAHEDLGPFYDKMLSGMTAQIDRHALALSGPCELGYISVCSLFDAVMPHGLSSLSLSRSPFIAPMHLRLSFFLH